MLVTNHVKARSLSDFVSASHHTAQGLKAMINVPSDCRIDSGSDWLKA